MRVCAPARLLVTTVFAACAVAAPAARAAASASTVAGRSHKTRTAHQTTTTVGKDLAGRLERATGGAGFGQMAVGVCVLQLAPRAEVVFQRRADELFKPASNQKVLTTAAAACLLPPDFTYRTVLGMRGDDLVVVGAGDPSIGDPRYARQAGEPVTAVFHSWAQKLKSAGLEEIPGNLLIDDSIFDDRFQPPGWSAQHGDTRWYTAGVGGLNFNDNCVDVIIRPSTPGRPAEVQLVPPTTWVQLVNQSVTAARGEPVVARTGSGPIRIVVSGQVSKANDPQDPLSIAVPDPGAFFASAMRTSLAAQGVRIRGEIRRQRVRGADGSLPADLRIIATHERRLADLFWRANKCSLNLFAEAMLKTLGACDRSGQVRGQGSFENGRAAIGAFLASLGVSAERYVIADGSGLSHENRITPAALAAVLAHMDAHPRAREYRESLAQPGEAVGTLRRRMTDLKGRVFAKTGYVAGVSALSGYVLGPQGRRYAFVVLCNDTGRSGGANPRAVQDEVCRILAGWTGNDAAGGVTAADQQP